LVWLGGLTLLPSTHAGEFYRPFRFLFGRPAAALHREEPQTGKDDSIEELANNIDWLEHYLDEWGTIVAKHPAIWGEARLTRHRDEYERVMFAELGHFQDRLNATIQTSDQNYLLNIFSLTSAVNRGPTPILNLSPDQQKAFTPVAPKDLKAIAPSPATDDATPHPFRPVSQANELSAKVMVEPIVDLEHRSHYVKFLQELRRINEGDDTSDSPGYALNLVYLPVSVLPGRKTRAGFGAEVTISATPVLSEALLGDTFRNLVVRDVVDQIALAVVRQAEKGTPSRSKSEILKDILDVQRQLAQAQCELKELKLLVDSLDQVNLTDDQLSRLRELFQSAIPVDTKYPMQREFTQETAKRDAKRYVEAACQRLDSIESSARIKISSLEQKLAELTAELESFVSGHQGAGARSRKARHALPGSAMVAVFGENVFLATANQLLSTYKGAQVRWSGGDKSEESRIHLLDAQQFLSAELQGAYDLLGTAEAAPHLVQAIQGDGRTLGTLIRNRCDEEIDDRRSRFVENLGNCLGCLNKSERLQQSRRGPVIDLAWAIVVEMALLNEQLIDDMRRTAASKGCCQMSQVPLMYFLPNTALSPEHPNHAEYMTAAQAFNEYVRCRWPVIVFALDPVVHEQNVGDVSYRRRELQMALSLGFLSGKMNAQNLTQYARKLEQELQTIALNRTVVGFSHGNDSFGWRFQPRVQTPSPPGNLGAFSQSLFGGPSRDADLCDRQLEPGQRDCAAIMLMPSFVPYCDFDVRTNWYQLTNPQNSVMSIRETVRLSRAIQSMQQSKAICSNCAHLYRPGEVDRLLRRVQQLDRELPLQSMRTQVPFENTLGGFEMFNTGLTDLAPELDGWYGAPGIFVDNQSCPTTVVCAPCPDGTTFPALERCPGSGTTLFLVGDNLSVHDTRIIAGGVCIPHHSLVSRQVVQVTIPNCVRTVTIEGDEYVDIHAATPYGVTSHLHVPVVRPNAAPTAVSIQEVVTAELKKKVPTVVVKNSTTLFLIGQASRQEGMTSVGLDIRSQNSMYKLVVSDPFPEFSKTAAQPKALRVFAAVGDRGSKKLLSDAIEIKAPEPAKGWQLVGKEAAIPAQRIFEELQGALIKQSNQLPLRETEETFSYDAVLYYIFVEGDGFPRLVEPPVALDLTRVPIRVVPPTSPVTVPIPADNAPPADADIGANSQPQLLNSSAVVRLQPPGCVNCGDRREPPAPPEVLSLDRPTRLLPAR